MSNRFPLKTTASQRKVAPKSMPDDSKPLSSGKKPVKKPASKQSVKNKPPRKTVKKKTRVTKSRSVNANANKKTASTRVQEQANHTMPKAVRHDAYKLGLRRENLPDSILEVIRKLTAAGYNAYIVGGGVRDELLGLAPKDFDAVTNATPAQVKAVFGKRCRIIGRRFQLAHVYSGRDMIEVATFRAPPSKKTGINHTGMVVRDNVWGTIEQDFVRRDFSINSLYYQPLDGEVLDFCNALDDVKNRRLRFLGNTQLRVDEDPVRLLRAIRFAAKLDLQMDADIVVAFSHENWSHLQTVSPHRLYDESLKLFGGGYITKALPLLFEHHAMRYLFAAKLTEVSPLVEQVARNTDARIQSGKSINPAFFYAALLWPSYLQSVENLKDTLPYNEVMTKAAIRVVQAQRKITAIPKFAESFIRETWALQPRLINPKPRQIPVMTELARFRAGYDFLYLREQSGDTQTFEMGQWWHAYQELSTNTAREQAIKSLNRKQLKAKRQPIPLDDAVATVPNRHTHTLPKQATSASLPPRRRRTRTKPVDTQAAENYKHMLSDVIRGERPQTHD